MKEILECAEREVSVVGGDNRNSSPINARGPPFRKGGISEILIVTL